MFALHPDARSAPLSKPLSRTLSGPLSRPLRHAFSLVELLLVCSLIMLLCSFLCAVITSIRRQAVRVSCMATEHQVYEGLALFAADNRGQTPLVCLGGTKQDNYYYYGPDNHSDPAGAFGILYEGGYVDAQRGWYCPANKNPRWSFRTTQNPWPPKRGIKTRGSYGVRPEGDTSDNHFPLLMNYGTKALVADICSEAVQFADHHRSGMNVTYGDGSTRYQLFAVVAAPYKAIPNGLGYAGAYNNAFMRVWKLLDAN